jgi:hypothetical protein
MLKTKSNSTSLRYEPSFDQYNCRERTRNFYQVNGLDEATISLDWKSPSNYGINKNMYPLSIKPNASQGGIKVVFDDKTDVANTSSTLLEQHVQESQTKQSLPYPLKAKSDAFSRAMSCETSGKKFRIPENVTIVSVDSGKCTSVECIQNLTYKPVTNSEKEKVTSLPRKMEPYRHRHACDKTTKWPQFNFGNGNAGSPTDFHILVLSQETYECNSFITKLMTSDHIYTAYSIENSEPFSNAQESDLKQIAKGFVDSIKGPFKDPNVSVEFIDFHKFKLINPLLMVVGTLEQQKKEEIGSVVSISRGAFMGTSGIIKEIRGNKALLSMTQSGSHVTRWVSRKDIEVLDDLKVLQKFEDLAFEPKVHIMNTDDVKDGISTQSSTFEMGNIDLTACLDFGNSQEKSIDLSLNQNLNLEDHNDDSSYISAILSENSDFQLGENEMGLSLTTFQSSSENFFQSDFFQVETIPTLSQLVFDPENSIDDDGSYDGGQKLSSEMCDATHISDLMCLSTESQPTLLPPNDKSRENSLSKKCLDDVPHDGISENNQFESTNYLINKYGASSRQKTEIDSMDHPSYISHQCITEGGTLNQLSNHDTLENSDLGEKTNLLLICDSDLKNGCIQERQVHPKEQQDFREKKNHLLKSNSDLKNGSIQERQVDSKEQQDFGEKKNHLLKSNSDLKNGSIQERQAHAKEQQVFKCSDNSPAEETPSQVRHGKWHVKDTSSALRFIESMSLLEMKEKLKCLKLAVQGSRQHVLERLERIRGEP